MSQRPSAVLARHRAEVLALAAQHGAHDVRVFGSVACGDDESGSDIDVLVRWDPGTGLMTVSALALELEDLLGVHVDLVSEAGLGERHDEIRAQARPLRKRLATTLSGMESLESGRWGIVTESGQRLVLDLEANMWTDGDQVGRLAYTRTDPMEKSWTSAVEVEVGKGLYVFTEMDSQPVWSSNSSVISVERIED